MTRPLVARANGLVLGLLTIISAIVGGVTWERFSAAREARDWSRHSYRVLTAVKDLNLAVRSAETGQRGFLLTGDESYLAPYDAALGQVSLLEGELEKLTEDNPSEQDKLRDVGPAIQHKLEELAQTVQLRRAGDSDAALRLVRSNTGRDLMRQIETALSTITIDEQAILARRQIESDHRGDWVRVLAASGTVVAVLGLLWAARLLNSAWLASRNVEAEQRQAALRLRTSFDSLSQGLAVFDADRRLVNWNDCFRTLLGLPVTMLAVGTTYDEIGAATTTKGAALLESAAQLDHALQKANEAVTYERSHASQHLEFRRTGMPDGGFVLTVSDMTKRAQAEGILRESQKMQAIGQLTGGIAHDFNNLLTVVLGNLEVLRSRLGQDHPLQNRVERGIWAAERGATLTRQLLAFARKQPLAPAAINLGAIVPDILPLLRRTLGEPVDVRYVETAGVWPAMADAAQVESALLNLALNARDAMPGGGRLTIELANKVLDDSYCREHADVTPGDYAMLAVTDTGHGMTPDILARVFEPFFTTKPDGKGTGLGLAMVFGFIKQSGGHIKIYSEPGEGTTIRLYLPRAVGAAAVGGRPTNSPIDLPRGSATVLVVEDEPAVREIACAILLDLGYRVVEASDGEEALRAFAANADAVDLLLTDVVLPGAIRGRDLAARITVARPLVRVLFMSGYTENSIVHGGRLDDGVQLIAKPFHREQLARKVADVLGLQDHPQGDPLGHDTAGVVVPIKKREG